MVKWHNKLAGPTSWPVYPARTCMYMVIYICRRFTTRTRVAVEEKGEKGMEGKEREPEDSERRFCVTKAILFSRVGRRQEQDDKEVVKTRSDEGARESLRDGALTTGLRQVSDAEKRIWGK